MEFERSRAGGEARRADPQNKWWSANERGDQGDGSDPDGVEDLSEEGSSVLGCCHRAAEVDGEWAGTTPTKTHWVNRVPDQGTELSRIHGAEGGGASRPCLHATRPLCLHGT